MQHYMHVRTNASVGYKRKFHKQLECRHLESIFFARGWTLSSLLLSPESGVDCPCPWFDANSVCCPASLPASSFVQPTLFRVPLPLPDTARFQVQKSFVWFRAKTDKGIVCLAGHPHSATRRLCSTTGVSSWCNG